MKRLKQLDFTACCLVLCGIMAFVAANWQAAAPQPACAPTPSIVRTARLVRIIDGDTYEVEFATRETIRLSNADTWESRKVRRTGTGTVSDEEIAKGKKATAELSDLLRQHVDYAARIKAIEGAGPLPLVVQEAGKRDDFGRVLAEVWAREVDDGHDANLGLWLKQHGHTRQ